jgi:RNA polymerase sigma factor (sigma-70 family)
MEYPQVNPGSDTVMVFLVDDEASVTDGLTWLLESVKIPSRAFASASGFLQAIQDFSGTACAVVDLRMPEMSGLELQQQLIAEGIDCPLVFLTAHGDVPAAVNAIQAGAVDFVQKPFNPDAFLASVRKAIRLARERRQNQDFHKDVRQRLEHLSARERDVLQGLVEGLTSKEIARRLSISPKTVDVHRANVIRKMGTERSAELLQLLGRQRDVFVESKR